MTAGFAGHPVARLKRHEGEPPAPVAGALTAGLFLEEFVPEGTPWAHLDIAGPFIREKDWKYYEAGAIGFGLKTLVDIAERFNEYQLMEAPLARSLS